MMEEIVCMVDICVEEVWWVMDIGCYLVSLDCFVGDSEDSSFGEFIEDLVDENLVYFVNNGFLWEKIEKIFKMLIYCECEIICLRYGLGDGYIYIFEEVGCIFKVICECVW